MATMVNRGTKKAEELIYDMRRTYYKGTTLYEVYGSCSAKKVASWEKIRRQCAELNGERLHITGAGSHFYSCMYAYPKTDGNTGEVVAMVLRKETASNTYELELPVEEYNRLIG